MTQTKSKFARLVDKMFTWACFAAGAALALMALGIVYDSYFPGFFDQDFGFDSLKMAVFSVFMTIVISIIAVLPFLSMIYLISGLFSANAFDQKGVVLSSIAVVASAIAVILAIDQSICDRISKTDAECLRFKFGFLFDQFSKGGFGDIFDIFDWKLSVISTSELTGLAKIYTLNFRMISALYLAMIVVAIYRRFSNKVPT